MSASSPQQNEGPGSAQSAVNLNPQGDVAIGGDVAGRDIIKTVTTLIYGSADAARNRRDQLILLERVKNFWIDGVLENSVHRAGLMELSMQTQPEAVEGHRETNTAKNAWRPSTFMCTSTA